MNGEPEMEATLLDNWHQRILNVDSGQDAQSQCSAILQQLESSAFLPNLHLDTSIQQYATGEVPAHRKWQSCEQLLRRDVEHFCDQFFELPVAERRRIHARLLQDAEFFPVLKRRLQRLRKGLEIVPELPADLPGEAYRLRDLLMELLTAAPSAAARIRREWQADIEQNRSEWIDAVRHLARHAPALVQAAPELTDWIVTPPKPKRRAKPVSPPRQVSTGSGSSGYGWAIALVVIFAIRLIVLLGRMDDSRPLPASSTPNLDFLNHPDEDRLADPNDRTQESIRRLLGIDGDDLVVVPANRRRERIRDELEQDETFQRRLGELAELEEDRYLEFGSKLFSVTREDGQLVIVFNDINSLVNLIAEEQDANPSLPRKVVVYRPGMPGECRRDYVVYCVVRDEIIARQDSTLVAVEGYDPSKGLPALDRTLTVYLERRPELDRMSSGESADLRSGVGVQRGINAVPPGENDE